MPTTQLHAVVPARKAKAAGGDPQGTGPQGHPSASRVQRRLTHTARGPHRGPTRACPPWGPDTDPDRGTRGHCLASREGYESRQTFAGGQRCCVRCAHLRPPPAAKEESLMPRRNWTLCDDRPTRRLEEVVPDRTYDQVARDLVAAGKVPPTILGPSRFPRVDGAR